MDERNLVGFAASTATMLASLAEAAPTWDLVPTDYKRGLIAGVQLALEQMVRSGEREELPADAVRLWEAAHQQVTAELERFNTRRRRVNNEHAPTAATVEAG